MNIDGKTLLHLSPYDIADAGFKIDGITRDQFDAVWHNLAKYYDTNWLELVADACESAGLQKETETENA